MSNKNLKNKIFVTTGVILITMGLTLLLSNYIKEKRDLVFSDINLEILEEFNEKEQKETTEEKEEETKEEKPEEGYEYYIATLEVPKAEISRGFYNKDSELNEVNSNIIILKESDYPDKKNGNVILAAHSGNYSNSYFTNLNRLTNGDLAYITYKNKKYTYKIVNIYDVEKTGTVSIYRNKYKNTLTMITCNLNDNTKQTIYVAELIEKE